MSNPFNCPPRIYEVIQRRANLMETPALSMVRDLGPKRCQWAGSPSRTTSQGVDDQPTTWTLDGKRASLNDLRSALSNSEQVA